MSGWWEVNLNKGYSDVNPKIGRVKLGELYRPCLTDNHTLTVKPTPHCLTNHKIEEAVKDLRIDTYNGKITRIVYQGQHFLPVEQWKEKVSVERIAKIIYKFVGESIVIDCANGIKNIKDLAQAISTALMEEE